MHSNPIPKYMPNQQAYCDAKKCTGSIGPKVSPVAISIYVGLDEFDGTAKYDGAWQDPIKRVSI